jgi:hypothetical protein
MSLFLLLHGAWHGGWCWRGVQEELLAAGHGSVAPDLPCDDVNAGWNEYTDTAMSAVGDSGGECVVVGHSLAGGLLPLIASRRHVERLVLVCAAPPQPGKSLDESLEDVPYLTEPQALAFRESMDREGRYVWPNFEAAKYAMYADCDVDRAEWAYARLRPQATRPFSERLPVNEWPDVPMTVIVCAEDRMGRAGPLRELARQRFGIEAIELPGGHSPFLSRPAGLTRALLMNS